MVACLVLTDLIEQTLEKARLQSTAIAARAMKASMNAVDKTVDGSAGGREAAAVTNFILRGFKIETLL